MAKKLISLYRNSNVSLGIGTRGCNPLFKSVAVRLNLIILLFLTFLLFMGTAHSRLMPRKGLFEEKCGKCHPLGKSLYKYKTKKGWSRIVERMRKKDPKLLSMADGEEIVEYLYNIRGKKETKTKKVTKLLETPKKHVNVTKKAPEKVFEKVEKDKRYTFQKLNVDQFIKPDVCGGCHDEILEQWRGSMHSRSFEDPLWQASTKLFALEVKTEGEILESRMCIKCHAPLGYRSHTFTSPNDNFENVPETVKQGVFCNWCHNIVDVRSIGNADHGLSPGDGEDNPSTMLGPFNDAKSGFHPTMFSKLHTQSEFCGLCHNVSHAANVTPIENTYDEWKGSPYNTGDPDTTVYCQDCHMRQTPEIAATGKTKRPDNPGFACNTGPKRPHVPTHYIVGGNTIPGEGFSSEEHQKMALDRLENAADIEIIITEDFRKSSVARIKVKVENSGAGHYLPTGMTEIRQMWLDVKVTDKTGRVIFRSGSVDENGFVDPDAVMYNTVLGNRKGEAVMNIALADRVLTDYRIPPKGYAIKNYSFFIPGYVYDSLRIEATLRYRSCSQSFANMTLKEDAPQIPIVDMAKTSVDISFH
ncbi:MAG: multiheme c-type cytochrome [Candidatus Anammoxibacter sp.]